MINNLFELDFSLDKETRLTIIKRYLKNKFSESAFKKDKQVYSLPITIKEFKQKQGRLNKKELI